MENIRNMEIQSKIKMHREMEHAMKHEVLHEMKDEVKLPLFFLLNAFVIPPLCSMSLSQKHEAATVLNNIAKRNRNMK